MTDDTVRCWLVERTVWDEDVVTLVYATLDGERHYTRQLSGHLVFSTEITAATAVDPDDLEPTPADEIDRYATEAERVAKRHEPDEVI